MKLVECVLRALETRSHVVGNRSEQHPLHGFAAFFREKKFNSWEERGEKKSNHNPTRIIAGHGESECQIGFFRRERVCGCAPVYP